jgi:DnaK suppressor protein
MAGSPEDAESLDSVQLSELRARLEIERKRLKRMLKSSAESNGGSEPEDPLLNDPEDFGEMGQDVTNEETELALSANDLQLLEQVEHALERMDEGKYGFSEVTGKPIPYERLDVLPWATTNVEDTARR